MNIDFPPVGGTRQHLVTCQGNPFGSFDTLKEAQAALEMWSMNTKKGPGAYSANSKMDWKIVQNPNFK